MGQWIEGYAYQGLGSPGLMDYRINYFQKLRIT